MNLLYVGFIGFSLLVSALVILWAREKMREAKVLDKTIERERYMDEYHRIKMRNRQRVVARAAGRGKQEVTTHILPHRDILTERFGMEVPTEFRSENATRRPRTDSAQSHTQRQQGL